MITPFVVSLSPNASSAFKQSLHRDPRRCESCKSSPAPLQPGKTSDRYSNCLGLSPAWNQVIIE
jgi:hypothetical protein